jgi:hypothetical protein
MPVGLVRQGIRDQLDWLDLTTEEQEQLDYLSIMLQFAWMGNNAAPRGKAVEQLYATADTMDRFAFLTEERVFARSDVEAIAAGTHPYYSFSGKPSERISQFIEELRARHIAPAALYDYWQNLLAEHDGNEFEAVVAIEFHRPAEASS